MSGLAKRESPLRIRTFPDSVFVLSGFRFLGRSQPSSRTTRTGPSSNTGDTSPGQRFGGSLPILLPKISSYLQIPAYSPTQRKPWNYPYLFGRDRIVEICGANGTPCIAVAAVPSMRD